MRETRLRSTGKSVVAILCAGALLTMSLGAVPNAVAADTWDTWPKKAPDPGFEQKPAAEADGAAKEWNIWPKKPAAGADGATRAGDAAEKKKATGRSYGTIVWIALGIAAVVGIAVAAGGGGGGGGGTVTNPGHQ